MEVNDLRRAYYDTAVIPLTLKGEQGFSDESIIVAHKPIDGAVWDKLEEIESKTDDPLPAAVRQLVHLDTHIKDLTDGGQPVEFTAEFWSAFHARIREKVVNAIVGNVPARVRFALALRAAAEAEGAQSEGRHVSSKGAAQGRKRGARAGAQARGGGKQ